MKSDYKGFGIEVRREPSLAGNPTLYMTVMRKSDGWFLIDTFSEGEDTIRDMVSYMKLTVDHYLDNPGDYGEED